MLHKSPKLDYTLQVGIVIQSIFSGYRALIYVLISL